jgi:uncharacterized protein YutE (UPF0331/DUF86 family)
VSREIATDRLEGIDAMLASIRRLPLGDREAFFADERNVWAAESCLRRALEGVLDIGRHLLAKAFAIAAPDYKSIARELGRNEVLDADDAKTLEILAGYRNRMVQIYHEITPDELFSLCSNQLEDVERIATAYRTWLNEHPERVDADM